MGKGISVFVGMNYTLEENKNYIVNAKKIGFGNIFTSLHIPETNYNKLINDFNEIVSLAGELGMNITADISPRAFAYLNADMNNLKVFKEMGIQAIRVDFGFTSKEIAEFTKNPYGLKIEINASTTTQNFLNEFDKFKPEYTALKACHNYYPKPNTGISVNTFLKKNKMLKDRNIEISSFIPSLANKRGPIFEGLPTLEIHRKMKPAIAAKHLFALGSDNVIFGDGMPLVQELESVAAVDEDCIDLSIETFNPDKTERKILFEKVHKNRSDSAEDVIRSILRANLDKEDLIKPHDTSKREKGFITIDNKNYLRYCGELEICKKNLPADSRVNVVGKVKDDELFLLKYIDDEIKFKFTEK